VSRNLLTGMPVHSQNFTKDNSMKRHFWHTAVSCGLAFCISSTELVANTVSDEDEQATRIAQRGKGEQRGKGQSGGNPQGGGQRNAGQKSGGRSSGGRPGGNVTGTNRGQNGGGPARPPQSNVQRAKGAHGGIHAPSTVRPRSNGVRSGQTAGSVRSPSFSRPPVRSVPGIGPRSTINTPSTRDRQVSAGSGSTRATPSFDGRNSQRSSDSVRSGRDVRQSQYSRIGNRPFAGNSIQYNNRPFNVAGSGYRPSYYRHNAYHGYWNGNRRLTSTDRILNSVAYGSNNNYGYRNYGSGDFGNYGYNSGWGWGLAPNYRSYSGYGYRPLGWGLGGWGLGSLIYNSGYLGYSNPYYVNSGTTVYNYTQPIPVYYNTTTEIDLEAVESAETVLNEAVDAFRQNDYDRSLDITNKGIAEYSDDAVLHEFRSLVLFANQDYQQSAATIHSVLAVGPGWDWTTMSGLYASTAVYTDHLRALEAFTRANPQDAASQFLLAYHYMTCGHPDAAARHFEQVVSLMPDDRVASDLLRMIKPSEAGQESDPSQVAVSAQPVERTADTAIAVVDPEQLVGAWSSTRDDASEFDLTLTEDGNFTWTFAGRDQKAQGFEGTYTVDQNVLVLERKDGGSLMAEVSVRDTEGFNFRLLGTSEDDKGLEFVRSNDRTAIN
jgi:tetratricopeptide (TPR) repeat protein